MILSDVNVLVYAYRRDVAGHERYAAWLQGVVNADATYAVSDLVLNGFLRLVTNPRVFPDPDPIEDALLFAEAVRGQPNCRVVEPGPGHWTIFTELCRRVNARGNLVPDAYLAALAIESGCEWATADRDFAVFPGLRWFHPLDAT